jgi:hypothetical protein
MHEHLECCMRIMEREGKRKWNKNLKKKQINCLSY